MKRGEKGIRGVLMLVLTTMYSTGPAGNEAESEMCTSTVITGRRVLETVSH